MAGGAEVPSLTGESQKDFVLILLALDAGKAVSKIPTTQVLVDHISNDVSQYSESLLCDDNGAAERSGWRFISEREFAKGTR